MPIRPELAELYPDDWDEIAWEVKEAAGWRCACTGECGRALDHLLPVDARCRNRHGEPKWGHTVSQSIVVLSVGHVDHDPSNVDRANLRAWCGGCHLAHDQAHHWHTRRERQYRELGLVPLFDLDTLIPSA